MGIRNGLSDACPCSQIDYCIKGYSLKHLLPKRIPVAYIQFAKNESRTTQALQPPLLQTHVVRIVEIIDP